MSELCREVFEKHQAKLLNIDYQELKEQFDRHEKCFRKRYATFSDFEKEFELWQAAWQYQQAKLDDSENTRAVLYRENMDIREKNTEFLKRIENTCKSIDSFFDDQVGTPSQREYCNFIAEIKQALRGEHV